MKVLFTWKYNGNDIKIAGDFTRWELINIPNKYIEFDIDIGIYEYKFIIDGKWCCDNNKPTIINTYGTKNNLISVNNGIVHMVHISDTHSKFPKNLRPAEILIHTGDFSIDGHPGEYEQFNEWIGRQKYLYKIVILGNHDLDYTIREQKKDPIKLAKERLSNCIVLNYESINLYGYDIYGMPWYDYHNWNYSYKYENNLENEFNIIPNNTSILLTHGPAYNFLDSNSGSKKLLDIITKIKPKYHLFGHIHQQYGILINHWFDNNETVFINSSLVDESSNFIINEPHYIKLKIIA